MIPGRRAPPARRASNMRISASFVPSPSRQQRSDHMIGDWLDIGALGEIPARGARTVAVPGGEEIAVFRCSSGKVYALVNRCPHKQGPLSQGIVHGEAVACPLHNWRISLATGEALG